MTGGALRGAVVASALAAVVALAGCGPRRGVAPAKKGPSTSAYAVCGSNGKTYPALFAVAAGVAPLYDGQCRRCEESACKDGEQCVLVPCPYREGAALDEACLQRSGPKFCMPAE